MQDPFVKAKLGVATLTRFERCMNQDFYANVLFGKII